MNKNEYPDILSSTCVCEPESDPSVDVPSKNGDDTPVHVLIIFLQRSHGYGEESHLLVVRDEGSVTPSVPRRFHHDGAAFVLLSFAPVLGVVSVLVAVVTGDGDGASQRSSHLLWSRQLSGARCLPRKPEQTQDWSCKRRRFTRHRSSFSGKICLEFCICFFLSLLPQKKSEILMLKMERRIWAHELSFQYLSASSFPQDLCNCWFTCHWDVSGVQLAQVCVRVCVCGGEFCPSSHMHHFPDLHSFLLCWPSLRFSRQHPLWDYTPNIQWKHQRIPAFLTVSSVEGYFPTLILHILYRLYFNLVWFLPFQIATAQFIASWVTDVPVIKASAFTSLLMGFGLSFQSSGGAAPIMLYCVFLVSFFFFFQKRWTSRVSIATLRINTSH